MPIALERMRESLTANGCVSITAGNPGRRTAAARFLNAQLVLAIGPLALARTTGASLLPVFTLRKEPGRFEVTTGTPIEVTEDAGGNADYAAAVQAYADMLTPFVLRDPGQWRGWRYTCALERRGGKGARAIQRSRAFRTNHAVSVNLARNSSSWSASKT